jgi:hypothetical protein
MALVLVITSLMANLVDWLVRHAIELLWMLTALGAASILASELGAIAAALTEGARTREEQAQHLDQRRQEHWRARHRHTHPQCAVCKHEEEQRAREEEPRRRWGDDDDGLGIFRR